MRLIYVALMIPGIVIGIATLVALVTVFDALNPALAALWPGSWVRRRGCSLGLVSLIAAHTLFTMALAVLIVRARLAGMDRSLVEASMDLYATPWATFRQITLPQLLPAIVAEPAAGVHLQLRRFRDRLLRGGLEHHAADLRVLIDPARRDAGDQRHRHAGAGGVAGLMVTAQLLLRRGAGDRS